MKLIIPVEQYSGKKLQLNMLGGIFFKKFNKQGVLIEKGGAQQEIRKLTTRVRLFVTGVNT